MCVRDCCGELEFIGFSVSLNWDPRLANSSRHLINASDTRASDRSSIFRFRRHCNWFIIVRIRGASIFSVGWLGPKRLRWIFTICCCCVCECVTILVHSAGFCIIVVGQYNITFHFYLFLLVIHTHTHTRSRIHHCYPSTHYTILRIWTNQ